MKAGAWENWGGVEWRDRREDSWGEGRQGEGMPTGLTVKAGL